MIIHIKHSKKNDEVARANADALRNAAITQGRGALLLSRDSKDAEPQHLLEKIIHADPFVPGTPADAVNWKPDSSVIIVDGADGQLKDLEAICPGFLDKFGPVSELDAG